MSGRDHKGESARSEGLAMTDLGADVKECRDRILELLNFLETEFLRVWSERGIYTEDLPNALAVIAVSAVESLKAVILLAASDDVHNAFVMLRRFDEHFTWMLYIVFCDDGTLLKLWFQKPHLIPSEKNHKLRSLVTQKTAGFFHMNPVFDFKRNFDDLSSGNVHVTRSSVQTAALGAMIRYFATNADADHGAICREANAHAREVAFLGVVGPETARFIEFLAKRVFNTPEFSGVSPGEDVLAEIVGLTVLWWSKIEPRLGGP